MRIKTYQQKLSPSRLLILLTLVLPGVSTPACKEKNEGTFVGQVKMEIVSYATGKFAKSEVKAENVTLNLAPNGSHALSYILTFDEKSPIRCKLEVTDRNFEDEYTMGLKLSGSSEQTCEVRDENGTIQTAKITDLSGALVDFSKIACDGDD